MVENQHGLGSTLSFGAKSVNPEILEALLIGREKIVNQLENRVKNIANDGLNHQVLIVGARGTGKTHLLSVLHHRIQPFIKDEKVKVAYFAEEEYGISGFLDFLVRILNAFIKYNERDAEFLKEQLTLLQNTPSQYQEETIQKIIKDYIAEKPLVILTENFNDILEALKHDGQSKLRNWLQINDRISIISTAQALSDDIGKEDKPFYGFFDEINLTNLDLDQSYKLLMILAELDQRDDVIEHLKNKGKAQVKAINRLVKGNHRLLITFYQFLKSDILSDLSVMFIKTLNDLKPYYETYIRYLPPQQQKILRFIALAKTPQLGTTIARECFIEQKSLSKQLSELTRKKLIEPIVNHSDKRNKLYDVAEPLLRISIEIGEHKEGVSALFVDFLALYYNLHELNIQKERFSKIYKECLSKNEKERYGFEISAREKAIEIQNKLNTEKYSSVLKLFQSENYLDAITSLNEIDPYEEDVYSLIFTSIILYKQNKYDEAEGIILRVIDRDTSIDLAWYIRAEIAKEKTDLKAEIFAREKFKEINPSKSSNWFDLGIAYEKANDIDKAVKCFKKTLNIDPKNIGAKLNLGVIYFMRMKYKKAEHHFQDCISQNPKDIQAVIFLAITYAFNKKISESKQLIEQTLTLKKYYSDNDLYNLKISSMLGSIYLRIGDVSNAINSFLDSLESPFLTDSELVEAVQLILKLDNDLDIVRCKWIEDTIMLNHNDKNTMPLLLLQTFRKYVLEGNKNSINNLPKEQREFFQKEILDFRKERLGKE